MAERGGWRLSRELLFGATAILAYLAAAKVLAHLLTAGNYGYFRDELYYVAAGERLQFGYVDFPPFIALAAAATRAVLGTRSPPCTCRPCSRGQRSWCSRG